MSKPKPKPRAKPKASLRQRKRESLGLRPREAFSQWLGEMAKLNPSYTRTPAFREFYWTHYRRFTRALEVSIIRGLTPGYYNPYTTPGEGGKHEANVQSVESQVRRLAS